MVHCIAAAMWLVQVTVSQQQQSQEADTDNKKPMTDEDDA